MKILVINGSPKGKASNSLKLANSFVEGLIGEAGKKEEVTLDEVHVASANIEACRGCFACWKSTPGVCCIKDDMKGVIEKLIAADVIVWSFPLFYYSVPGILKNLIDRQLPMNLPFMAERKDGYGSGSHEARFDMSGKRHVLISTCGFYSAEGNYDSVRLMFDHFVGKGKYETIFCGQGELFRVKELSARTGEYLSYVRDAGAEFANGGIGIVTREKLETLLYPRDVFEQMADASWGVKRESARAGAAEKTAEDDHPKNEEESPDGSGEKREDRKVMSDMNTEDAIFTRQMAAMYDSSTWNGSDKVIEINYRDLARSYQILLGKDGSEIFTDGSLTATTRIDTTFKVWTAISRGEINGADAFAKQMYSISGDFSLMMNWGKIFGRH